MYVVDTILPMFVIFFQVRCRVPDSRGHERREILRHVLARPARKQEPPRIASFQGALRTCSFRGVDANVIDTAATDIV